MNRDRIMLSVWIDLDPMPGTFHSAESARHVVNGLLKHSLPHYSPIVGICSYGRKQPAAFLFDSNSHNWVETPEYNLLFVTQTLNHAKDKLRAHGHLFLNEMLDMLGVPKCREGQLIGWVDTDISYDYEVLSNSTIKIYFHTEGVILDRVFEDSLDRVIESGRS